MNIKIIMEFKKVYKKNGAQPGMRGEVSRVTDQLALGTWQWLEWEIIYVDTPRFLYQEPRN